MARLHIALQDGFSNDEVVVAVDGRECARRTGVTTMHQIGYADALDLDLPAGGVRVEVSVPTRGLAEVTPVHLDEPVFLGVSIERDGALRFQFSQEPFGYV